MDKPLLLISVLCIVVFFGALIFFILLASKLASSNKIRNDDALAKALTDLNDIFDGKLYIGDNSTIIFKDKIRWEDLYWKSGVVDYLCVTEKGNWFKLNIGFINGILHRRTIEPFTVNQAKTFLYSDLNLYCQHFGEPEKA